MIQHLNCSSNVPSFIYLPIYTCTCSFIYFSKNLKQLHFRDVGRCFSFPNIRLFFFPFNLAEGSLRLILTDESLVAAGGVVHRTFRKDL